VHYRWWVAKSINVILKFYFIYDYEEERLILIYKEPAYHGASFWRDVVLWLG